MSFRTLRIPSHTSQGFTWSDSSPRLADEYNNFASRSFRGQAVLRFSVNIESVVSVKQIRFWVQLQRLCIQTVWHRFFVFTRKIHTYIY